MEKDKVLEYITPKTASFEGFSSKIYKCPAGFNTIGYGRNIEHYPLSKEQRAYLDSNNNEITEEVAMEWLKKDLEQRYYLACDFAWFRELDNVARAGAVVDLIYNLGYSGFKKFKKFIEAMQKKDYKKASAELVDSKWYNQVGNRAKEICKMIESGC